MPISEEKLSRFSSNFQGWASVYEKGFENSDVITVILDSSLIYLPLVCIEYTWYGPTVGCVRHKELVTDWIITIGLVKRFWTMKYGWQKDMNLLWHWMDMMVGNLWCW
jgi:hypothetical protein